MNEDEELSTRIISAKEEKSYNAKELMILYAMRSVKNPYRNLTVSDISKDLNIGINTAYELFKKDDFPSIEIGKTKTVTLLAYLIWKLEKHR